MTKKFLAYGGIAAGVGLMYAAIFLKSKPKLKRMNDLSDAQKSLLDFATEHTLKTIAIDHLWFELCDRAADFATLAPKQFSELLYRVSKVVKFQNEIDLNEKKLTISTPRLYASKMHSIIECVRSFREQIMLKASYSLEDFDEIAADIQKKHDDDSSNMILHAQSMY